MNKLEFYRIEDAEESDPNVTHAITADNLDDLENELADKLDVPIALIWVDASFRNGIDSYEVVEVENDDHTTHVVRQLGVAYVGSEELFK